MHDFDEILIKSTFLQLLDVFGTKSNISLVIPYMITDLEKVIKEPMVILSPADIKTYVMMTLRGLEYLHRNWILHRVSTCT